MYSTWLDIHGYATIAVESGAPAERQLREMLKPFVTAVPTGDAVPDIVVGADARPLHDASHGEHAFRFTDDAVNILKDRVQVVRTDSGFEVRGKGELLTSVLPLVERVVVPRGAAMIHAATVAIGDRGVFLPAWGGVGKTSTVAKLTKLPEGRFMGDDWGFVTKDQRLLGYAKPMFFKPHHRELYPHVFGARKKPLAPSSMTDAVGKLATAVHPVIIRYPKVADVTRKWSPEHLMAHPDQVFPADKIAHDVPLALTCFVERYDGTGAELVERDVDWMVRRTIGNFHSELPGTSKDLVVAMAAVGMVGLEDYFSEKAEVMRAALSGAPSYSFRVPADWPAPKASDVIAQQVLDLL